MKNLITILTLTLIINISYGQKKVNVTFEKIKEQCSGLPVDQRVRLTVARFSITTPSAQKYPEFGDNLATMLANALQEVNCYKVLESIKNSSDLTDEINFGQGNNSNKTSAPKQGKMLGAQVVVTAEITEFSIKNSGIRIGLIKVGSEVAHLGFILKMVNPETREIIFSQSINVEGKTSGASEFGAFGVNVVSSTTNNPALANACEQGIIKAVEFLASKKDQLPLMPASGTTKANANAQGETEIVISNANFNSFNSFSKLIGETAKVSSLTKSLTSGTATFNVSHSGTTDELLESLSKQIQNSYEIIGFDKGKIELKAK